MARIAASSSFNFDTFDALQTGQPAVVEVLGRTHSRLIQWSDFAAPTLEGDLAASWEQPDRLTLLLHLDRAARWHDVSPVAGRPVTADDVADHLKRAIDLARAGRQPSVQPAADLLSIERVSARSDRVVALETSHPDPFLPGTLAGRFALVQAPEAVAAFERRWHDLRPEQVAGSGPFRFSEQRQDGKLVFRANTTGHRSPLLDGLEVSEPAAIVSRFRDRELDEVITRDRRDAALLRSEAPGALEMTRFEEFPVVSTFFVGAPPWNNPDLRRALSGALNRTLLADTLFGGRAVAAGPVAPVTPSFALPPHLLAGYPGYAADPAVDARLARALWDAAGGPALGTITIDFPSIFDPLYSASSVIVGRLNEVLGAQFRAAVESYTTISKKALEHRYGNGVAAFWFGWGPAFPGPDPSRDLVETYHSTGPGFATLGYRSSAVDEVLDSLGGEFNVDRRRELCREAARLVLDDAGGGVIDWLVQRSEVFRSPGYEGPTPTPFWSHHLSDRSFKVPAVA